MMTHFQMRLDRWLSTAVFHPLRQIGMAAHGVRLPVLMYHSLSDDHDDRASAYYKTSTDPLIFRQQMRFLAAEGYKTIHLSDAVARLQDNQPFAGNTVVITFDDGFRDFYTHGFPVLQEFGLTAAIFLPTAFIGDDRRGFNNIECLTWQEVREMRKAGIEFGSHTVNHPKLRDLSPGEIERELVDSKAEMEQQLGESINLFCYPYAFPQENRSFAVNFRRLLAQAGYDCCLTTELGRVRTGDDPYRMKRLPANSLDDPALFRAKLEGSYDWLAVPQGLIKKIKHQIRGSKAWKPIAVDRSSHLHSNSRP